MGLRFNNKLLKVVQIPCFLSLFCWIPDVVKSLVRVEFYNNIVLFLANLRKKFVFAATSV